MDLSLLPEWARILAGLGVVALLLGLFTLATVMNANTAKPDNCKVLDASCCGSPEACTWTPTKNFSAK